ncbi:MAG: 16S rRNA (guanine(966)-N(2))-methyltransferase RsmD [Gammaproteobacteria bacterium]|nr:16S rRNA (guanine(966)-N(2))-methyltransferase RsmD [Gammaproteobacteria bacterium]
MKTNSVRIIGGKWRGRKINFPDSNGLRPSSDFIRETLFNWLMASTFGSICLDAFAGSGVIGFEALSRGAEKVYFIDQQLPIVRQLQLTASQIGATQQSQFIQENTLKFLEKPASIAFDLIFLDPPFNQQLLVPCLQAIQKNNWLKPTGLIYAEFERGFDLDSHLPEGLSLIKDKKMGAVRYGLLGLVSSPST